jgi:hypothetical protein
MTRLFALLAFALCGALACAPPPPAQPSPDAVTGAPDGTDQCGAKANAGLIGKALSDPAVPPATRLVRHIRPGDAVTEDFVVARLNLYATESGSIERINCG